MPGSGFDFGFRLRWGWAFCQYGFPICYVVCMGYIRFVMERRLRGCGETNFRRRSQSLSAFFYHVAAMLCG